MKTNYLKRILLTGIILLNFITVNAKSVTGFTSGYWWQAAGFAGLGNQNELLAFGEYTIPSDNKAVTVKFKLKGEYAKFVNRVCLYASKYDASTASNSSSIAQTFVQLWDNRDPSSKVGAVLLSQTTNISGNEISLKGSGLEGGTDYVFFVAADIANNIDALPAIKGSKDNFTRIGAEITEISSGGEAASLSLQFAGTNGKDNAAGLRVLVPQLKTMYAPGDYYSKYYRIPAIVTASDGSLVAVSDARKQHIHDITNDIDMLSRRSNDNGQTWNSPITIAKGDSATKTMRGVSIIDCANSVGYGDASLAALPNGDLLCAFIHGYGLSATGGLSDNSYVISRDNGQTWGESKYMRDKDGNKLMLLTSYRGNIAPGNMCVVKSGLLAGKVLACYRTTNKTSSNRWGYTNQSHNGNYFVTYDPTNDYWNILSNSKSVVYSYSNYSDDNFFYQNSATSGNGTDDEAQLIEIGENTFLMSIRSEGTNQREFAIITLNEGTNSGSVYYSAEALDNCGMELKEKANGAICKYTALKDGAETEYLIHTVPATQASSTAGNTTRSGLTLYTVPTKSVSSSGFSWAKGLCISDPDDDLDETAQYSSITTQQDGTIGILFEDYPQVVRVEKEIVGQIGGSNICTTGGDFILRSRYMNLRINDILDVDPIQKEKLLPPIITPESQTYDVEATTTWGDITIKNPNPSETESKTNYNIQVFNANNVLVKEITEGCEFEGDSIVLKWDGEQLTEIKDMLVAGYSVRVNAKCFTSNQNYNSPSEAAMQIYYFQHPTHKVKIVAMPFSNSGDPTISIQGNQAEKDTWIVVGEGQTITLYGGYGNEPFHFECFSTDSTNKNTFNASFNPTKITANQYTVTIPTSYSESEITFYAWYKSPAIGVKTRVNTNYYNSEADDAQWIDGKLTLIHKYEFTDWCKNTDYVSTYDWEDAKAPEGVGKPQFPSFVPEDTKLDALSFADGEVADATAEKELYYPTTGDTKSYRKYGLDLTACIMSDTSTVQNYNAIVMVKRDDAYMTDTDFANNTTSNGTVKAPSLRAAQSKYYYYVVNGYAYPFNSNSNIAANAQGVKYWYNTSNDATVLPTVAESMTFNNTIDKTSSETPKYYVVFFIVNKNTLPSIQNLVDGKDYIFKVEHPIYPNANKTGVDVTKVANGLLIVGKQGCATFASNVEQMVRVYNMLGQQVASFNLNGSHTVELPQGIYVAGGQKFIVK